MLKKIIALFSLLFLFLFTACGEKKETAEEHGKHLNVALAFFDTHLDPAIDYQGWYAMRAGIAETLIIMSKEMTPEPWLAESFQQLDDTTWEFKIRKNITFHNGVALTPEKVKASLERSIALNNRAKQEIGNYTFSVREDALIVKTDKLDPFLADNLSEPMYSIVDVDAATNAEEFTLKPVATGPFIVDSSTDNERVELVANKNYWNGTPKLDSVSYLFIPDANTRMLALQSGEVDVSIGLSASALSTFQDYKNIAVDIVPSTRIIYAFFNPNTEAFQDKRVREAINYAIDKETMANITLNGTVKAAYSPYSSSLSFGSDSIEGYRYDVKKAEELLKEAGYHKNSNHILEKDGKELRFKFVYYSSRAEIPFIAQYVQSELAKLGIVLDLVSYEKLPLDQYNAGAFDIGVDSFSTATNSNPSLLLRVGFTKEASDNFLHYFHNDRVEEIAKELSLEKDAKKRFALAKEAQELIVKEGKNIFLAYPQNNICRSTKVKNFSVHPLDFYQMNKDVEKE